MHYSLADGPTENPASQFTLLTEYRHAVAKSMPLAECRCCYCQPADVNEVHAKWHEKFRRFFALRAEKYPECKDFTMVLTSPQTKLRMYQLLMLWKLVDNELPYFGSSAFLEFEQESVAFQTEYQTKQAAAKRAAEKKAVVKALKASTNKQQSIGLRLPREYTSKKNRSSCVFFWLSKIVLNITV